MSQQQYRVLFCDSLCFWGGGEHWMVVVARALLERSWTTIIAGRTGGEILNRAEAADVPTVAWPYRRDFDIATTVAADRYLKEWRPDLVVVTTGRDIRTVGLVARRRKIPVIWRMGLKPKHNWIHRVTGQWVIRTVLAPSDYVRRDLEQFPWLRGKITVIPNGIAPMPVPSEERILAARSALGLRPDELIVLYAGRLLTVKGVDLLIRAFTALAPRFPTARLVLVGDGNDRYQFHQLVAEAGMAQRVDFRGYSSDPSAYFDACDLFVLASRSETFGFVLLEAMQRGKAIVAARVGAVPEVVTDDCAVLVPANDPGALAEAMAMLLQDDNRRSVLGGAGRRRVEEKFTADRMIEATIDVFERVISERRPTAGQGTVATRDE